MKLQRILVATDLSLPARQATDRAVLLAKRSGADLRIVHVIPERSLLEKLLPGSVHDQAMMARGVEQILEILAGDVQARLHREPSWAIKVGPAARTIQLAAREFQADLLVIGVRGEGAGPFFNAIGGTAHKLMLMSEIALLLVRRPADDRYRNLLAAVDDSDMAPRVLEWARGLDTQAHCRVLRAFQAPYAARLRLLEVAEAAVDAYALAQHDACQRVLVEQMARAGFDPRQRPQVVRGDPMTVVMDHIALVAPDLVVVGRHGAPHHEGQMSMLGSVALGVALNAPCDVLQVR